MFIARTVLTITLLVVIGGLLWMDHSLGMHGRIDDIGFNIVILAAVVLSVQEFYDLARQKGYTPYSVWGTACAALMVLADWIGHHNVSRELHLMGVVAFIFLCGIFILQGWLLSRKEGLVSMAVTAFAIVYVWGLAQFIVQIRYMKPPRSGIRGVLLMLAVVKAGDIFAYLVGSRWGRHRPFPRVSPKKSWEGYIGGTVGSLLAALGVWWLLFDRGRWPLAIAFALPVGVVGHLGDLAESVIKRDLDAKDSAVRLPGLGGVLDVVDSVLLAGPVAFYLLKHLDIM